jgi:hypothetical protein
MPEPEAKEVSPLFVGPPMRNEGLHRHQTENAEQSDACYTEPNHHAQQSHGQDDDEGQDCRLTRPG